MITNETNMAELSGKVLEEPKPSHSIYGESFFTFPLEVPRLSGHVDVLPVILSEKLLARAGIGEGARIGLRGQLRSYNRIIEGNSRLELKIFAKEMYDSPEGECINQMEMTGFLCKPPIYRTTPFGVRLASDQVLQQRQRKARCFAGASLGASHQVAAFQHRRDRLLLNRGGFTVTLLGNGAQDIRA